MPIRHTVVDGDSVIKLSEVHGLWAVTIWNHPENADLKARRPDMNILMPGDVVYVPDRRPRTESRPTGARHVFKRRGIPAVFRIQLFNGDNPRAKVPYRLTIKGEEWRGLTDEQGVLSHFIPATAEEGELVVEEQDHRLVLQVRFGHLRPADDLSGIQRRLTNLGFDCGPCDGTLDDTTRAALHDFQGRFGLEQTGEPDDATRAKLERLHDEVSDYDVKEAR